MPDVNVTVRVPPHIAQRIANGSLQISGLQIRASDTKRVAKVLPIIEKAISKTIKSVKNPALAIAAVVVVAVGTGAAFYWNRSRDRQPSKSLEQVQKILNNELKSGEVRLETIKTLNQELGSFASWWEQHAPDRSARLPSETLKALTNLLDLIRALNLAAKKQIGETSDLDALEFRLLALTTNDAVKTN